MGDFDNNTYARAFFTFDLSQLNDVIQIVSATIYSNQVGVVGNPLGELITPSLPSVVLESVDYGDSLDFNDIERSLTNFCSNSSNCSSTVLLDVYSYDYDYSIYSPEVANLVEYELKNDPEGNAKIQVRLRFPQYQSTDFNADYLYFYPDYRSDEYKPKLKISIGYEHP
jgi:hypothetical protein